jgi:hypothetical protein
MHDDAHVTMTRKRKRTNNSNRGIFRVVTGRAAVRLVAAIHGGKQELGTLDGGGRSVLEVGRVWGTGIDDGGFYLRFLFFIYQTDVYCISRIYPMTGNKWLSINKGGAVFC